jgi:hypothetical protein
MFVKQIDKKQALELAVKGKEILIMEPNVPDPKEWSDYEPLTLDQILTGCLFFCREPTLEVPMIDEPIWRLQRGKQPGNENSSGGQN